MGLLLGLLGCGAKETKVTPYEVVVTNKAIEKIYAIKEAFEKGEIDRVRASMSEEIYHMLKGQEEGMGKASLRFKTYWVEVTPKKTIVFIEWDATWQQEEGSSINNTGIGGFVMEGDPPRLVRILRDNPFRSPGH